MDKVLSALVDGTVIFADWRSGQAAEYIEEEDDRERGGDVCTRPGLTRSRNPICWSRHRGPGGGMSRPGRLWDRRGMPSAPQWRDLEGEPTLLFPSQFQTAPVDQGIVDEAAGLHRQWNPSHGLDINDAILAATVMRTGGAIHCLNKMHYDAGSSGEEGLVSRSPRSCDTPFPRVPSHE